MWAGDRPSREAGVVVCRRPAVGAGEDDGGYRRGRRLRAVALVEMGEWVRGAQRDRPRVARDGDRRPALLALAPPARQFFGGLHLLAAAGAVELDHVERSPKQR